MENELKARTMSVCTGRATGRAVATLLTAALLAAAPTPAAGQDGMELTFVTVGQTTGDDVNLLLGQVSAHRGGLGLMPVFSLQTYLVEFPGGSTWAVSPGVGLRYRASTGMVQGKVGYSWRPLEEDDDGDIDFFGGSTGGVTTSTQAEYWGTGAFGVQGIGSYNWGSEYLWSRARATARFATLGDGSTLHGGGEVSWQGDMGDEEEIIDGVPVTVPNSSTVEFGPVLQWNSRSLIGVVGGGWRQLDSGVEGDAGEDSTWYFKVEMVFTPR